MAASLYKFKADFIDELEKFYINVCGNELGITGMSYVLDGGHEYMYIYFPGNKQKRLIVDYVSDQGILLLFTNFLTEHERFYFLDDEFKR